LKAIADTGFLVAFGNRNDEFHQWAVELARGVTEPLLTCDAVLAETAFHLQDSALTLSFVLKGLVKPAFHAEDHLLRLTEIALRYADRNPDFADVCLIRMSELHRDRKVITTDANDFTVYRRNRREVIPLLLPTRHR
jgi:predicted nucleic acid-binding protein